MNTQAYSESINTPIETELYPVLYATSTMGTGNYKGFVHEIKRAIGIAGVGWESVMQALALVYHQEDKNIGQFEREYWNGIYQDNMSWIDLNKIAEDLENKSNQSNTSTGFDSDFEVNYINK